MTKTLDGLLGCAGRWTGTSRLQDPHSGSPEITESSALVAPVLDGRFVRIDYTWSYQGAAQSGSILVGYDGSAGQATAHWIDTWHMGDKVMALRGPGDAAAAVSVVGSYGAGDGPEWGWRIVLTPSDDALRVVMFNITPDGLEDLAVEAAYARA